MDITLTYIGLTILAMALTVGLSMKSPEITKKLLTILIVYLIVLWAVRFIAYYLHNI